MPQALTEHGKLWMPAEPLANEPAFTESLSAAKFFAAAAGSNARNTLRRLEKISTLSTREYLSELLTFADDHDFDVAVLPEYLSPISCLDLIIGFSRSRAIVTGMGVVRNRDEASILTEHAVSAWQPEQLIGRNVSVLVENERVHLSTKQHLSEHEIAESGAGPIVVDMTFRDRTVRVAVAVCMDYLRHSQRLLEEAPEVVCIPARTATTRPFLPDAPRDFVRLIANNPESGGSTIVGPSLRGSAFTNKDGVKPLQAGCQGAIMIDYDRFERRPASLVSTKNRLVVRSQIITRSDDEVAAAAVRALEEMRGSKGWTTNVDLPEQISRWLDHLKFPGPLRDALEEYRRALATDMDDEALFTVLSTHLVVSSVTDAKVTRARQARFVIERIGELIATGISTPPLGALLDAYRDLADEAPMDAKAIRSTDDGNWSFALRLGAYDSGSAVSTLPRQLNFLRAMGDLPADGMSVTYRMQSAANPLSTDLRNYFDVIVSGRESVVNPGQIEGQLRSMLVESWPISTSDEKPELAAGSHCLQIIPDFSSQGPTIRDDWSPLFDLIRTQETPIIVEMRAVPMEIDGRNREQDRDEDETFRHAVVSMPYMATGDLVERRASAYFNLLREMSKLEPPSIGMSLVVSSMKPIPPVLADTIKYEIFGTVPATVRSVGPDQAHADPVALTPSQLIRLFHPPYGHFQARGLRARVTREISYEGPNLPTIGTKIGTARVAGPIRDRRVDVLLDETARVRHLYAVGRTGTGKTNFLKELCRQDMEAGRGFAVLDPHGDLVDYLVRHSQSRLKDIVLLDFGQPHYLPAFNPLTVDITDSRSMNLHIGDFLRTLESRYYNEFTGPVFDDMVRQALETMFQPGFPVPRSLDLIEAMYRNREIRKLVSMSIAENSVLRDRWNVFEAIQEGERAERIVWMLSKLADLMPAGSRIRSSLCSTRTSPLSIEHTVWNDGILLVKLPESVIGAQAASFLGSLILRRVQRAVFDYERGTGLPPGKRAAFSLIIDEFQKFATSGIEGLIAEARKFGCGLVLAHQNLEQLYAFSRFEGARSRELLNAILGNVGSVLAFRVGPEDAELLARMLKTKASSFDELPMHKALCRLTVDKDDTPCFTLTVDDSDRTQGMTGSVGHLRERMIEEGYWVAIDEADAECEMHLPQFEQALEKTRETATAQAVNRALDLRRMVDENPAEVQDHIEKMTESMGESAMMDMLSDILSDVTAYHLELSSGVRQEIVERVISGLHDAGDDADWSADVAALLPSDANPTRAADLVDGLRAMAEALSEIPADDLRAVMGAFVEMMVSGYVGRQFGRAAIRDAAARITDAAGPSEMYDSIQQLPAALSSACKRTVNMLQRLRRKFPSGDFLAVAAELIDRREVGPFDIDELQAVPRTGWDFGSMILTVLDPEIKLGGIRNEDRLVAVSLTLDGCELRLDLLPTHGGPAWGAVRRSAQKQQDRAGVSVQEILGPYGPELVFIAPDDPRKRIRLFGIDGPGWLLRAHVFEHASASLTLSEALTAALRGVVVRVRPDAPRGLSALPLERPDRHAAPKAEPTSEQAADRLARNDAETSEPDKESR
ncbi:DUF3710 domain-containing protein [Nocardia sp. NBC_00508]|uniref:DUF3710 domain-containing protein n=1 Tax=Nocardia sp. NBC_00508 TaxID=2975992 RepID=UPI002E8162DA|nr:DUF3710 domain-containing protein [Nocardia sp. NBC_00508]WUD65195.1 DUF3710 domain-containing protein [Nocardia sp. NBC_00508]